MRGQVMRRGATAVSMVILAGVLGGCGDDAISKADFVAAAGKICKGIDTKLIALDKSIGEPGEAGATPAQQQGIVKGTGAIFKEAADELANLDQPSEGRETVKSFVAAMRKGADEVMAAGATPEKADELLSSGRDPMQKANDLADKYGLTECGAQ